MNTPGVASTTAPHPDLGFELEVWASGDAPGRSHQSEEQAKLAVGRPSSNPYGNDGDEVDNH